MRARTAPGRRGPYAKSAEQRRLILDAAVDVFSRSGYHSGSFRDIAAAAGISEAGLRHHFRSKASLLAAALQHQEHVDAERMALALDPRSGLQYFADSLAFARESVVTPRRIELYSVLCAESHAADHPAHEYFLAHFRQVRQAAAVAFAAMEAAGQLRPGVRPVHAAMLFVAVWDGLQLQWLHERETVDVAAELERFLGLLVREDYTVQLVAA